jgi:hypothetical protein
VNLSDPDLILAEIVEDLEAAVLQQQKDFQATISQLQSTQKDQAAQILKMSNQLKHNLSPLVWWRTIDLLSACRDWFEPA